MLQLHNHCDYDYFIRNCDWYLHRNFYHLCCFHYTDKYTHTILQYINSIPHTHTWIQNPPFWAEIESQFSKAFNLKQPSFHTISMFETEHMTLIYRLASRMWRLISSNKSWRHLPYVLCSQKIVTTIKSTPHKIQLVPQITFLRRPIGLLRSTLPPPTITHTSLGSH
jgi:hypothetical protein